VSKTFAKVSPVDTARQIGSNAARGPFLFPVTLPIVDTPALHDGVIDAATRTDALRGAIA
jgi:hypothetical protein